MIKFKIEDQEYFLPEIMTIGDYVKIYKIKDLYKQDYFTAKIVSIVSGAPIKDLLEGGFEEVAYLSNRIAETMPTTDTVQFEDRFTLDGIEYGIFPNWKDLTFAEYIDLDTISTKNPQDLLDHLHILAAIMYRPVIDEITKHNYEIELYDTDKMMKRAELFKNKLDVRYVLAAQHFFTIFAKMSSEHIQMSLITTSVKLNWPQKIKMIWKMWRMYYKIVSPRHLGGSLSSTGLRKMMLRSIISSIK